MIIKQLSIHPYEIPFNNGQKRTGSIIHIIDKKGNEGWGEIAPLPKWSQESLEDSLTQLRRVETKIKSISWTDENWQDEILKLKLLPSLEFGIESALLSFISPLQPYAVAASALLMGTKQEILEQAKVRKEEGYTSAKLKVGNLNKAEAAEVIDQLKNDFKLRIDVNRAWSTKDSLDFFSRYALDTFDYVEEPFQNPQDLKLFNHPLAVDESFPTDLSLEQLETLPTLKALIYKPTMQGGLAYCYPLQDWAEKRGVSLVMSASFETSLGLATVASLAHRLNLKAPVGIGTYHYMDKELFPDLLDFRNGYVTVHPVHLVH